MSLIQLYSSFEQKKSIVHCQPPGILRVEKILKGNNFFLVHFSYLEFQFPMNFHLCIQFKENISIIFHFKCYLEFQFLALTKCIQISKHVTPKEELSRRCKVNGCIKDSDFLKGRNL